MYEYKGKTLVIIGAGFLQVPAIEIAKNLGITTIVTDMDKDAPGMKIADYPIVMSTRDTEGTAEAMIEFNQTHHIDGVITVGTDMSMTVAAVSDALDLPGIRYEDAVAASNKLVMRKRLRMFDVPEPDFYACRTMEDLRNAADKLGYPFVLKPADNMGARGCMKVEDSSMLDYAFSNAKSGSINGELIAEEYMDGPELSIDALVYNGEVFITGIADRIIEREPYFIEMGHVLPSALPQSETDKGVNVFIRGIKALGITNGAAKGDINVTKNGGMVGEIAARLSGGFMSACTYPYATGVSSIANAIDIALGWPPHDLTPKTDYVSIEQAIVPEPGIVTEISGVEEALAIDGVKNIFLRVNVGDEVVVPHNNVQKAGNFIVCCPTREEAWETVRKVHNILKVTTKKKKLTWQQICENARPIYNGTCKVCPICDGRGCRGQVPGMGGIGNGDSFVRNVEALRNITINSSYIHNVREPDTSAELFGIKLSLPVVAAPIAGADINFGNKIAEIDYTTALTEGCRRHGSFAFLGDGAPIDLFLTATEAIRQNDGHGGLIIKPRCDTQQIRRRVDAAVSAGAPILGMDVDGCAILSMKLIGQPVEPKSRQQLKEIIGMSDKPFILKGIMTVADAVAAVEVGASGIIVGNHGGRVSQSHPASIANLAAIRDAVGDKVMIIYDGGVRTGEDVFKAIALGANLVMVGRPFVTAVLGGGADGVGVLIEQLRMQLARTMLIAGTNKISDITKECVSIE